METGAWLWLLPGLPVLGGLGLLAGGHRLDRLAAPVGVVLAATASALSAAAVLTRPVARIAWLPLGGTLIPLGLNSGGPDAPMALLVSVLALLIFIYSLDYMAKDRSRARFFGLMSGFLGSMLGLVLAGDLLSLIIFWEGVGICSYALIAFWYEDGAKAPAANRAFLGTRFADLGLYIAAMGVFIWTGSFSLRMLHTLDGHALDMVTAGLLLAACGKSAQLPFSGWLSGAMQGPSPVSALLHSATLVAAGAFLLLKLLPILAMTAWALPTLLWIGTFSALTGAALALYQQDLKQILAASTLSQFGYVFAALGAAGTGAASLHILNHAVFKSLLFLSAGVLAHQGLRTLPDMGGLRQRLPWTATSFTLGMLALASVPPFGAFFSKEDIFGALWPRHLPAMLILLVTAPLTAAYAGRAYFTAFTGTPHAGPDVHESANGMRVIPLTLAILSLVLGALGLPAWRQAMFSVLGIPGTAAAGTPLWLAVLTTLLALLGLLWGYAASRRPAIFLPAPGAWRRSAENWFGLAWLLDGAGLLTLLAARRLMRLERRWLDTGAAGRSAAATAPALIDHVPRLARTLAQFSSLLDRRLWDRLVASLAAAFQAGGNIFNALQNGLLHRYYAWMSLAVAALVTLSLILNLWRTGS